MPLLPEDRRQPFWIALNHHGWSNLTSVSLRCPKWTIRCPKWIKSTVVQNGHPLVESKKEEVIRTEERLEETREDALPQKATARPMAMATPSAAPQANPSGKPRNAVFENSTGNLAWMREQHRLWANDPAYQSYQQDVLSLNYELVRPSEQWKIVKSWEILLTLTPKPTPELCKEFRRKWNATPNTHTGKPRTQAVSAASCHPLGRLLNRARR